MNIEKTPSDLIKKTILLNAKLPDLPQRPRKNLFDLYGMKVLSANEIITNNLKQNQQLSELRDWLLLMLMNGQVKAAYVAKEEVLGMVAEGNTIYNKN